MILSNKYSTSSTYVRDIGRTCWEQFDSDYFVRGHSYQWVIQDFPDEDVNLKGGVKNLLFW